MLKVFVGGEKNVIRCPLAFSPTIKALKVKRCHQIQRRVDKVESKTK
jgi:hypothetical protein